MSMLLQGVKDTEFDIFHGDPSKSMADDVRFKNHDLVGRHQVTAESVRECTRTMPEPAKTQVLESLGYLQTMES
jgi:hypothetical protein